MDQTHTILIVDDNRISRRITSTFLKSLGISPMEATDGEEAIEFVQGVSFTAVFMNLYLPGINGYETTKKIRQLKINSDVPVIAITTENLGSMSAEMIDAGFTNVLNKPFVKVEVLKVLESLSGDSTPIFDYDKYKKTYKDVSLQNEIIQTFLDEEESDTARIKAAFKTNDPDKIYSAVHYMKGSFSYLKASKILIVTQKILDLIKQGNLPEALKYKEDFFEQYVELVGVLKKI